MKLGLGRIFTLALAMSAASCVADAGTVQGKVINGTTGKPAVSVEVILIQLQGGMQPVSNTKTDAQGQFTFDNPGIGAQPMLVRAVYRGVNFHQPLPPGKTSVEVQVYDLSQDLKTINVPSHLVIFQPNGSTLTVAEQFLVRNESKPPLAYFRADGNFQVTLPDTAQLRQIAASGPSGMPVVQAPIELGKNKYAIRRLGALLLAQRLDDFPEIARKAPRVVVYHGNSKLETKLDRPGTRGYAVAFRGLIGFVMAQLPQNEIIEGALRKNVKLVPEVAIRELIANALVHQDLHIGGTSIMIEIYSNRVEISSPGEPVVPVERFIDGYQSRNERLASLMRRLRICEEKSSGIDKVIQAAEIYQLPAPDFRVNQGRTVVTLFGPKDFDDMDREDRIRACYQHCALKFVMSERMTNQSLRERFNLPESKATSVSQVIALATQSGMIKLDEKVGLSRKFARYVPFWA